MTSFRCRPPGNLGSAGRFGLLRWWSASPRQLVDQLCLLVGLVTAVLAGRPAATTKMMDVRRQPQQPP